MYRQRMVPSVIDGMKRPKVSFPLLPVIIFLIKNHFSLIESKISCEVSESYVRKDPDL